jgi:hypothetical protein
VSDSDSRFSERVPLLGGLHGEIVVFQPMLVREISRVGVSVETRFPLQIDSLHEIRLTLGEKSVVMKGRVVHAHLADMEQEHVVYRIGLEFVQPSPAVAAALAEFLDALRAGRSGVQAG